MDYLQQFLFEYGPLGMATMSLKYARTGNEDCFEEVRRIVKKKGRPRVDVMTINALNVAESKLDTPHLLISPMASWCYELSMCQNPIDMKLAYGWGDGDDVQRLAACYYIHAMIYANKVDALLLARGVDILDIQKECGVRLLHQHNKGLLADVYGTETMVDYYMAKIAPPTSAPPTKDDAASAPAERVIKEEELRKCFNVKFCGRNKAGVDYMAEYLIPDIRKKWDGKYYAKLAWLTYNSPSLLNAARPATWKAWYRDFARMAGVAVVEGYKPSTIKASITDNERRSLYYLIDKIQ